jgi:Kef-type K+ transport system membrane component KefB
MLNKIISLFLALATMSFIIHAGLKLNQKDCPTLVLGFILIAAYCIGQLLEKIGLPGIVGYILTGLFMGPYFLKFYTSSAINELSFINNLALAFIAFCAGGELRLSNIRRILKPIIYYISGITLVVFTGVTLLVFSISSLIPFLSGLNPGVKLAVSAIFGIITVARSPSSAIAIISETKAKGPYTDLVLSVSVAMDVIIIMLFAVIISVCQIIIQTKGGMDLSFIAALILEIAIAFLLGYLLGKFIVFLIEKVKVEFAVVIIAMGFLVIEISRLLGEYLHEVHNIGFEIEPLLICMAAGFTVQNFSDYGEKFLKRMDSVSLPIYIAFFAMTGAAMNINILRTGWLFGLIIVVARLILINIGSYFSGKLSKTSPKIYKNAWLGFITQAGVSLGLLTEVVRRFPDIGPSIQTILIAAIIMNQIIGPIAFKYGLKKVGETNV